VRKTAQIAVGLIISLLALWLAFRGAELAQVGRALREANYFYIVPAVAAFWVGLVFRALSWRVLMGGRVSLRRAYDVMNEGYLLNNVLPLRLGEFGRAYLVSRGGTMTASQALSSIVVERVVDLLMILVLLAAFLPLLAGFGLARDVATGAAALGLAALAGIMLLARFRRLVLRVLAAVLRRANLRFLHAERWLGRAHAFLDGLAVLQQPRVAVQAAFWSGMAWVAAGVGVWALLQGFLPGAPLSMGFLVLLIVGLGIAIPSAPGAAGVFEVAIVEGLALFDVDRNLALSFALVYHATHLGLTSLLGGLALAQEGETLGHLARAALALVSGGARETPAPVPESAPTASEQ
jgi:uncharacterized protein (TIRG00374 family)